MNFGTRLLEAQGQIRPFFLRLTNDPFLAEEVIQFASVQCWRRWPEKNSTEMKRLMVTIGRRFYLNHREKERNQKSRLAKLAERLTSSCEVDYLAEKRDQVRQALQRLPNHWRELLERVIDLGQTNQEIAKAMGKPLSTIINWRSRALARLREILTKFPQK